MYKLKCKCLNITIHAQKGGERETDGQTLVSEFCTASFFSGKIVEIKLAVGGITKEVDTLVHTSTAEDWDIYRCINCETDAYVLHAVKGFDRVLISNELEKDPEVIKKLENSSSFSPTFKIMLNKKPKESSKGEGSPVLLGQDQLNHSMNIIQESIKKYLKAEESEMNERIKEYTAKQQELFFSLKTRAFQDKAAIFSVLSDAEEKLMQCSIHEAMTEASEPESLPSLDLKHSAMLNVHKSVTRPSQPSHIHSTQNSKPSGMFTVGSPGNLSPITHKRYPHLHKVHVKTTQSTATDADPMFALDGFTNDCEPFFESEEEDLSSDNSFQSEAETTMLHSVATLKKPQVYSTSVPISLPTGTKTAHSWEDDDDVDTGVPEFSKIGESMRALARSVQGNSEDMFGELPRPRLFTGQRLHYR